MLISVNLLKNYINLDKDIRDIADGLTDSGSHVDSINSFGQGIKGVVVGKILNIEKHPNADKLVVCQVDVDSEKLTIVTAAKNVFEGAVLPVAKVGASLSGGFNISPTDFRGITSYGMFCSYEELGFNKNVIPKEFLDGVLILDKNTKVGIDIGEVLDFSDKVIDFEITPNRPDCLSVLGMAREAQATFNSKMIYPALDFESKLSNEPLESLEIDPELCNKAVFSLAKNVKIERSPQWLQNYLMKSGIRPINNIVDITNFVMLEYSSPIHAYDYDKLKSKSIKIDSAKENEKFITLDKNERTLKEGDIVIRSGDEIISLAGIMGGLDSEVTENSKNILFEVCSFNKSNILSTARRLNLRSEASTRFEKGVPMGNLENVSDRILHLIDKLSIGEVSSKKTIKQDKKEEEIKIVTSYKFINDLLGTDIPKEKILSILESLNFRTKDLGDTFESINPVFREDVSLKCDLAEEVGRIYSFSKIKLKKLVGPVIKSEESKERSIERILKQNLFANRYLEGLSYSFISPKKREFANIENGLEEVKIINPLGEEYSVMRTTILTNLLDIAINNEKNGAEKFKLYELGNIFFKKENDYIQARALSLISYGDTDFYKFKAEILEVLASIGLSDLEAISNEENKLFHKTRCADLYCGDKFISTFGELNPKLKENMVLDQECI